MAASAVEGAAVTALRSVLLRVRHAAERAGTRPGRVRVVAVSKTKPDSLIRQVYDAGHRCFGENYVQEIVQKAPQVSLSNYKTKKSFHLFIYILLFWQLPEDIEWHFIGHLQSNKAKTLLGGVPNLALFEGVDNEKIANCLDRAVSNLGRNPLKVFIQVNTSGEASKSGIDPSGCVRLAEYVKLRCPNLDFSGLMTIGMPDYTSTPENFRTLSNCRVEVCKALGMAEDECELSMGMSGDFEQAIEMGSTNVRVGSTIFGSRDYSKKLPN
ncbi:proline synthase co-transcribed bacterial homolog protein isoform X1 [Herrania umbratica]|uniref:Pyridoxal phosphate homeostasis protein n=1 Tax=Herrania umbratica TaxID=108875 RepID=A0A6J1ALH9_9ROSI|nr:proline synthase co-transcribed bacterial homolog protein isoform X1 [Herrania umbratica]